MALAEAVVALNPKFQAKCIKATKIHNLFIHNNVSSRSLILLPYSGKKYTTSTLNSNCVTPLRCLKSLNVNPSPPEALQLKRKDFPPDFIFGAPTSALQTEGAGNEGGRGPSTWDGFIDDKKGDKDVATDSFNKYKGNHLSDGSQVKYVSGVCTHPRSHAYGLGITAALVLLAAQIVITFANGCSCCRSNPCTSKIQCSVATVCFVLSWGIFVLAFLAFLGGAEINNHRGVHDHYNYNKSCYARGGVFSVISVLSLISVALGIFYYLAVSPGKQLNTPLSGTTESGIPMGQPQVPPNSHEPVFVHEDTYMRRKFT